MKRLHTLMWLAVLAALVPFLALPEWLTKALIIAVAIAIAGVAYSLKTTGGAENIEISTLPTNPTVEANQSDLDKHSDEDDTAESTPDQSPPTDITDPDADRFVATNNTYKSRSNRLRG